MSNDQRAGLSISDKFRDFHAKNPKVYELFKKYALEAINAKATQLSASFIVERIRWEAMMGGERVKINNDFSSRYGRLFVGEYPEYAEHFAFRVLQSQ